MIRRNLLHRARTTLWLATLAILIAALSPTLNALRSQGQPRLFTELCTAMGFVRVPLDATGGPTKQLKHGPECSWCLSPASLLALPGTDALRLPAAMGEEPAPEKPAPSFIAFRHHAFAWAQAPPAFS